MTCGRDGSQPPHCTEKEKACTVNTFALWCTVQAPDIFPSSMGTITVGDQTLAASDFQLLGSGCWYNDNVISFFIEHLRLCLPALREPSPLLIVPPNLLFFLAAGASSLEDIATEMASLSCEKRDLVILPVNSASSPGTVLSVSTPMGAHWSLLVYERSSNTFLMLDSLRPSPNIEATSAIAMRLHQFFRSQKDAGTDARVVVHPNVPSQSNSADCGPFTCSFIEQVVLGSHQLPPLGLLGLELDSRACESFRDRLKLQVDEYRSNSGSS